MRILYLTDNASVHNRRFLQELVSPRHASTRNQVWSWNLTSAQPPEHELPAGVVPIVSAQSVTIGAAPSEFRVLAPQLQCVLKELRPDILHAGPVPTAGYLAALADFHPLLVMSWGSDLLLDADRNSEWNHSTLLALERADAFFADCDAVRRKAESFRAFADSQVVQFPWGIKPGVFSPNGPVPLPSRLAPSPGATTFIYTRSYDPLYGTDVLFDGFLRARSANPSLRLLLLGGGSQAPGLRRFVEDHALHDSLLPLGPQPVDELPMWFRAADAYISCAKSDGTSISLLEAMATGLPVIVTDIPSNREWISEPENGWLAQSGSPEGVAAKMLLAAKLTPQERMAISECNRRIVAERADWDRNFPRLLEMYGRLIATSTVHN